MIRMMLYLVTNGTEHAYWNSGHWDSTERFHGKCLLDDDDARDALRDLNNDNGEWFSKEVQIGVANDPAAELAALRARVAELEAALQAALEPLERIDTTFPKVSVAAIHHGATAARAVLRAALLDTIKTTLPD